MSPIPSPRERAMGLVEELRTDIYAVARTGVGLRRLTRTGDASDPVWSPDGKRIVFARARRQSRTASLWSMRTDGTGRRQLTEWVRGRADVPGSFSPDGELLAFTRTGRETEKLEPTTAEIWVMNRDGSRESKLADRAAEPAFSPDGSAIAFVSDRDENGMLNYGDQQFFARELYVTDADGSNPQRLSETRELNEASPSWIPEGTRIAYQMGRQLHNAEPTVVMEMNADGTCPRRILGDFGGENDHSSPSWRPGKSRRGASTLRC